MACPAATATSGDGATVQPCSAVLFLAHVTLFVHLFWGHSVGMGRGAWQHWQFWPDWAASRLVLSALLAIFLGGVFRVLLFCTPFLELSPSSDFLQLSVRICVSVVLLNIYSVVSLRYVLAFFTVSLAKRKWLIAL